MCVCVCERTCLATRTGAISSTRTLSTHTCVTQTLTYVIPTGQRTTTHLQKHTHIRQLLHTHTHRHYTHTRWPIHTHTPVEAHTNKTVVTHTHTHTPGHSATLDWHTVSPPAAGRTHMSVDWPSDMEHSHLTERERESNSTPRSSSVWIHSSVSVRWVIPAWQLSAQVCIRHGSVRLQICAQLQALALQRRGTRDDFPHRQEILTILGQGGHGPETHTSPLVLHENY